LALMLRQQDVQALHLVSEKFSPHRLEHGVDRRVGADA
jgi:hypothetical protein